VTHETKGDEALTSTVRLLVAALVLALASLTAGVAGAATLSDTPSAADQYVEVVPTGDGNATPTPRDKTTPLSRGSAQALEATDKPAAAALKKVATSSAFGASKAKLVLPKSAQASPKLPNASFSSPKLPNASFAGSLKEMGGSLLSGGGRPLGLLVGLVIISVAAAVMARKKNRSAT